MRKTLRILTLLFTLSHSAHLRGQAIDPSFAPTSLYSSGVVRNITVQADGSCILSGIFSQVNGVATSNIVRVSATGVLDQSFTQHVGIADSPWNTIVQPDGRLLVLAVNGSVTAGGITRPTILRLNADGTADTGFNAGSGAASGTTATYINSAVVQPDGKIIAGGYFSTFNGIATNNIVRLLPNGSVDPTFRIGTGADNSIQSVISQPDGKVLVGGDFEIFDGHPCYGGVVRLNADGSYDSSFSTTSFTTSYVISLTLQPDGKILVANSRNRLARLLSNGQTDFSFHEPVLNGSATGMLWGNTVQVQPDGRIVIGGSFSTVDGVPQPMLARLLSDGNLDTSFQYGSGPAGRIMAITVLANGSMLIGGDFSRFSGTASSLVQLTASGSLDTGFAASIRAAGSISSIVRQTDGKIVLGGRFVEINGVLANNIARLNDDGTLDAAFTGNVGTPLAVSRIVQQPDGKLLIAYFSDAITVRAQQYRVLVRLLPTGTNDAGFAKGIIGDAITTLALLPTGKILIGGSSTTPTVQLLPDGSLDTSFKLVPAPAMGSLYSSTVALPQPDGKILLAAQYNTGTSFVVQVARYEATGAIDNTFTPAPATGGNIQSLALQPDGKVLAGGSFSALAGVPRTGLGLLAANGSLQAGFIPTLPAGRIINEIVVQPNGRILLGGSFTNSVSLPAYLARLLPTGEADASFTNALGLNSTVGKILIQPDGALVIGGSFSQVAGQIRMGIARITDPNVLHVANAQLEARTQAWPVPAHETLNLHLDAAAQAKSVELVDQLGRTVLSQPVTRTELTVPVQHLRAGIYVLRVNYAAGPVTRRVVKE